MSDSTTFEVTVPAENLTAFSAELVTFVESVGCSHVTDGNATTAEEVLKVLQALASHTESQECLILAFPADHGLLEFQLEYPDLTSVQPGKVAVGCFWVWCKHSEGRYAVSFTSATRSISALMKESDSVQGAFRALAKFAEDGTVQVTNEWHEVSVL